MAQQNIVDSSGSHVTPSSDIKKTQKGVVIRHAHGAQIRADPSNHQYIDHKGGQGDWSKWNIYYEDNNQVLIQNQKTLKYLTIDKKSTEFLANGEGVNIYCRFRIHYGQEGLLQLESLAYPGHYMSVKPHEGVIVEKQPNMNGNYFQIFMHGMSEDDIYFVKPYPFQKEDVVIIRHPHNGGIAVIQNKLSDKGTKEKHSRWVAIPQMSPNNYSTNGKDAHQYSTSIDLSNNIAIKEIGANINTNTDVEMKEKEKKKLNDDNIHKTDENINNNNNNNTNNSNGNNNNTSTGNNNKESNKIAEDKSADDNSEDNNPDFVQTVKFRHEASQKYLMISENREIQLTDNDTEYCLFIVHVITKPNVVKFESWKIGGAYIGVKEGGVIVGKGGPHSQMTVLRKQ